MALLVMCKQCTNSFDYLRRNGSIAVLTINMNDLAILGVQ